MGLLHRFTRRQAFGILGGAVSLALVDLARAQTTAGCEIGFVNGLLTVGGAECDILQAGGVQVAAPSHLAGAIVDDTVADTATDTTTTAQPTSQEERKLRRREHRQRKKGNQRSHKRSKRNRKKDQQQDKRDRRRLRPEARCSDFTTQKEAVEWLSQHTGDRSELDPDNDGAACEDLPQVKCNDFASQEEAEDWVSLHGFTPSRDPYNFFRGPDDEVCPDLDA